MSFMRKLGKGIAVLAAIAAVPAAFMLVGSVLFTFGMPIALLGACAAALVVASVGMACFDKDPAPVSSYNNNSGLLNNGLFTNTNGYKNLLNSSYPALNSELTKKAPPPALNNGPVNNGLLIGTNGYQNLFNFPSYPAPNSGLTKKAPPPAQTPAYQAPKPVANDWQKRAAEDARKQQAAKQQADELARRQAYAWQEAQKQEAARKEADRKRAAYEAERRDQEQCKTRMDLTNKQP